MLPINQPQEVRQTLDCIPTLQDQAADRMTAEESLEIDIVDSDLDEIADYEKQQAIDTVLNRLQEKSE